MIFIKKQFSKVFLALIIIAIFSLNVLYKFSINEKKRLKLYTQNDELDLIKQSVSFQNSNLSENIMKLLEYSKTNQINNNDSSEKEAPLIFIGGYGRSGTTLMRAILDVHPLIRCGPETKVIPTFISFVSDWKKKNRNLEDDLKNAGVQQSTIDTAIAKFIYHVMENHGKKVPRLCAKDPDNAYHFKYLHSIFPNAKFIYMVRDGRAAAYSYMLTIKEQMNNIVYRNYLNSWTYFNRLNSLNCEEMGLDYCKIVRYEDLVLHPEKTIRGVVEFLNVSWTDEFLKHHKHFDDEIAVSKTEWSTDQILKPINTKSLTSWVGKIAIDFYTKKYISMLLQKFNYGLDENNLNYGENQADSYVMNNNVLIEKGNATSS